MVASGAAVGVPVVRSLPLVEFTSTRLRGVGPAVVVDVKTLPSSHGVHEPPPEERGSSVVVTLGVNSPPSSKNFASVLTALPDSSASFSGATVDKSCKTEGRG